MTKYFQIVLLGTKVTDLHNRNTDDIINWSISVAIYYNVSWFLIENCTKKNLVNKKLVSPKKIKKI